MTTPHDKALIAELAQMYDDHLKEHDRAMQFGAYVPVEDNYPVEIPLRILRLASECVASLPLAGKGDGWNRDMDAAPRNGKAVLVCLNANGPEQIVHEAYFYSFDGEDKGWFLANEHPNDYTAWQIYPDAWRPLPAPPSLQSDTEGGNNG